MMSIQEKYKKEIANYLTVDSNQVFLYWKGRVALFALLQSMNIKQDDEVILPAFTCVVVPNAILYLGAKPVYVDIEPSVLNTNASLVASAITEKTKCIIIQNTFGLSHDVEEIVALAKKHKIWSIEDCTHGFGGTYKGKPNGSFCDAAFYSSQWNKPFSTGVGGFALVNNKALLDPLKQVNKKLQSPKWTQAALLFLLVKFKRFFLNDYSYWFLIKLYRVMSRWGWFVGSSSGGELTSISIPESYFLGASNVQAQTGIRGVRHLGEMLERRRKNGSVYQEFLKAKGKWHYPTHVLENHSFLKYPIFVKDRHAFLERAEKSRIQLGDWFVSPIHPVEDNFKQWLLNPEMFPIGKQKSVHILNLPTDLTSTERVLLFLTEHESELL